MKTNTSTVSGEEQRQAERNYTRPLQKALQQSFGTISEVHPTLPLIKVRLEDGSNMASSGWTRMSHSVLEIIHRFGTLRPGLKVVVMYTGDTESNGIASIVGIENEVNGLEDSQKNEVDTSLYEIYTPGSGIG